MSLHGGLYKGQGRRLLASAAVVVLGLVIGAAPSIACSPADKVVWVCKVVGPPNHYRLETGNNPIRVAEGSAEYLAAFADSQPSFVVAHDSFALCEDGFPSEGQGASVVAPTITTAPSCNAPGVVTALPSDAYTWNVSTDGTTYTAVPKTVNGHDYILSGQTEFAFDIAQLTGDQCSVAPTSVTPTATARLGSCTEAGHVDLGVSPGYSWGPNTGTTNDPTYTATANEGYVLTGTPGFTFHGISKFDPQSTACFVPPPATTITTLTPGPATVAPVVTSPGEVEGIVQEAPTVTTPAATTPAATAAAPTTLAFTGAEPVPLSLCGLLALVLGAVLTVASRRPRAMRQRARLARK